MKDGKLTDFSKGDWRGAINNARNTGNFIEFKSEQDAKNFVDNYKSSKYWSPYLQNIMNKYHK